MHKKLLVLALVAASFMGAAAAFAQTRPAQPPAVVLPDVDLPVLASPKNINDVINADDLVTQTFPGAKVKGDMIRDTSQIIGMAAKRPLQAGQPIRLIDLRKEQLVNRGDEVSLIFKTGALEITASGKALEPGGLGDSIKVTNTGSNRTVDAKVTGPKQAEIHE